MANTPNLGLPLIDSNMTADVPRDVNALANAVDAAVGDMPNVPTASKKVAGAITELHEDIEAITPASIGAETPAGAQAKADAAAGLAMDAADAAQALANDAKTKAEAALPFNGGTISDADALAKPGIYNTPATFTGSPFVGNNGSNQGYLEHYNWGSSANYRLQIHTPINSTIARRYRLYVNGAWNAWRTIWDSVNNPYATQIEAESGSVTSPFMNPLRTKQYVDIRLKNNLSFQISGGVLQYNDGGTWKSVGGGVSVASTNRQYYDATERLHPSSVGTSQAMIVHKFIPRATGEIRVRAQLKGASASSEGDSRTVYLYASSSTTVQKIYTNSDSIIRALSGPVSAGVDWRLPIGSFIMGNSGNIGDSSTAIGNFANNTTYQQIDAVITVHESLPIYFTFGKYWNSGSFDAYLDEFELYYDIL